MDETPPVTAAAPGTAPSLTERNQLAKVAVEQNASQVTGIRRLLASHYDQARLASNLALIALDFQRTVLEKHERLVDEHPDLATDPEIIRAFDDLSTNLQSYVSIYIRRATTEVESRTQRKVVPETVPHGAS